MANIKDLLSRIESGLVSHDEKLAALAQVENTIKEMKQKKQEAIQSNVSLIVDALKTMQAKVEAQLVEAKAIVPERGPKGDKGDRGLAGKDGVDGKDGKDGLNGKDGKDGQDGVSVTDAKIDFDGSLIITLSTGKELNVGEVVPFDLAEKIKVVSNGGGTSQGVLDTLASLQDQINSLIPSQTGNSGKFLTTDGTNLSWASNGSGTVTSVAMSVPTGLSVSGSPITTSGTLAVTYTAGYSIPTDVSQTNWNTAYSERNQWDGGATGLVAATGRTSLGLGTAATMTGPSGSIVGTSDTQTLTNKRIDPRIFVTTSASSVTPDISSYDGYYFTAQAATLTINATTGGTPAAGDKLIFRIKDNGTPQTLSWTTSGSNSYRVIGVTLPTTTTASKVIYVGCIYNATESFWDVVAVTTQA